MNRRNILKLAAHMRSIPADKYDQTKANRCLLAHMIGLFGVEADPNDPIAAKQAAVELLGVEKGQADFLYADYPLGRRAGEPSPYDAYMVLKRLALIEDKGVAWCFHLPLGDGEIDLDYDWDQGGGPPICELPDVRE